MKRQGLVQMESLTGGRWLDLSAGLVGSRTSEKVQWIDRRSGELVSRRHRDGKVESVSLPSGVDLSDDSLVGLFLIDEPWSLELIEQAQQMTVVDSLVSDSRESVYDLHVRFELPTEMSADARRAREFEFELTIDTETNLPESISIAGTPNSDQRTLAMSYLKDSASALRDSQVAGTTVALASDPKAGLAVPPPAEETGNRDDDDENDDSQSGHGPGQDTLAELPLGAANQWKAVPVVRRSDDDVLLRVNALLDSLWKKQGVVAVDQASDIQLLRRSYLDLAGRTPTVTEVRHYLNSTDEDRYARLIDKLLDSPDHASQLAAVWRGFLIPDGVDLDAFGGREAFEKWLADEFETNQPYDEIVRKLLLAEGRLSQSGPLLFYSALKLDAHQLAARTSRAFLGMRLECAQCHDHPFEPWTQEDFWSYAAFFARISRPMGELENVSTVMRVRDIDRGEVMLPETDTVVPPRFLGVEFDGTPALGTQAARRRQLASWLTGAQNPYFARATVNRMWGHMFGRGIVDPVDDFGMNNEPVSPELLDTLASQFIDSGFDLRKLIRTMALSKAYRLSSSSASTDDDSVESRLEHFAQMNVKTLTAAQLYDCIAVATLLDKSASTDYSLNRFGNSRRESFLQQFASPATNRSEYLSGIPQALLLMNGTLTGGATGEQSSGLLRSLEAPFFTDRQRLDVLFMATLSREATAAEVDLYSEFVPENASPEERSVGLSDFLWALLNSAEFTLNH